MRDSEPHKHKACYSAIWKNITDELHYGGQK